MVLIVQGGKDIEESFVSLSFKRLFCLHLEVIALCLTACTMECTIGQCGLKGFSGGDALVECVLMVDFGVAHVFPLVLIAFDEEFKAGGLHRGASGGRTVGVPVA